MTSSAKEINIEIVQYSRLKEEMKQTPVKHWEEVPFGNFNIDLHLCHGTYIAAESVGYARFYSVTNKNNKFIGYMSVLSSEMLHHKNTMQATTDSFYIHPSYRSKGVFKQLIEFVENDLRNEGIRFFSIGLNPNMPSPDLVEAALVNNLSYLRTEVMVTKEL